MGKERKGESESPATFSHIDSNDVNLSYFR